MSMGDLPTVRGSSMSSRSIKTPTIEGQMTAEDMMNPSKQMLHSISQIESDLSRIQISLEKPDPTKYLNRNYQINKTYDKPVRPQPESAEYQQMLPGSAGHSQFQPSYVSRGGQSMGMEEFPPEDYYPEGMYGEVFDEKIVPMHNKDPIDFAKVKDDGKTDPQIGGGVEEEKFTQQEKDKIEIMSQYFKQETVKQLMSKNWQIRKKGLESFISELPKSLKENGIAVQEHAINVFFSSCKEKLTQITDQAMKLFEVLLEESKKSGFELKFESNKTASMITEVLDK